MLTCFCTNTTISMSSLSAPPELVRMDKRYRYIIFNHVGFYASYFASIYEVVGTGIAYAEVSSDKYLPENCVRIILPIKLEDSVRDVLKKHMHSYGYCVPYVVNVLKDLDILEKDYKADGVDELYYTLYDYKFSTDFVKSHMNKEGVDGAYCRFRN